MVGYNLAATPKIEFGSGKLKLLPKFLDPYGNSVLLITGQQSFTHSDHWDKLLLQFEAAKIRWKHFMIEKEPTPQMIDSCVQTFGRAGIDCVIAIGGGSVIDGGKAISAMLCHKGSVKDYLEGVGTKLPTGRKIPFIAVPTTAGTGSEATKNAVVSEIGPGGYKKSLRHDRYVPDIAIVDPELTLGCPKHVTAQSGMDAFTQLLESYVSTKANAMTDALAVDGIRKIRDGLESAYHDGDRLEARENVSYAAMLSGITLANAGLGTVHGFASSIGGFFDIPHGLVCARMMEPVNRLTIDKLKQKSSNNQAIYKYARIGKLFSQNKSLSDDDYIKILLEVIARWTEDFKLKKLSEFGVKPMDFGKIIAVTDNKNNPVVLDASELEEALKSAI
jgi:alcohol dehydrogenase class IV